MSTEITLSTDIHVITAEINAYKRVAGEAIFEIGRRLKHVKENDLAHGQWSTWCTERIGMDRAQADKFIRVFDELGGECTYTQIGLRALYEIATLPPEAREQPHPIPSTGEVKTVDEMTVRELREVKAELKRQMERADKAEADYETVRVTLESVSEQPPHIEYVRDDTLQDRLRRYEERFGHIETYESSAYRIPNATDVSASVQTFAYEVRVLLKKYAYITQYARELTLLTGAVRDDYDSTVDSLAKFAHELRNSGNVVINGSVIDVQI